MSTSPFVLLHHRSRPAVQSLILLLDIVNQTILCFCLLLTMSLSSLFLPVICCKLLYEELKYCHRQSIIYNISVFSSFICYPLFHQFPLFKRCKICNINFLDWKWLPPLWNFSENSSVSEASTVPQFLNIQIFVCFLFFIEFNAKVLTNIICSTIYMKKSPKCRGFILMSVHHYAANIHNSDCCRKTACTLTLLCSEAL